jgi:methylase of polypeptide subunit release factors
MIRVISPDPKLNQQLRLQIKVHQHTRYTTNIILDEGYVLKNFLVESGVLRPEIMTSLYLAKWLFFNNGIYARKRVLDLGSGTGIVGVIAGLYGAKQVVCSDIDPVAVKNSKRNIQKFKLDKRTVVVQGDLFENVTSKFDVMIFNHPFFGNTNTDYADLMMINKGELLKRFLIEAKQYLSPGGVIVMPYYHLAGKRNDPGIKGPQLGYQVSVRFHIEAVTGIQKGPISIYELSLGK